MSQALFHQKKNEGPLSVTQAAAMIRGALEAGLPSKVRIVGEISNLSDRSHWFFSLKDGGASLRCVMFASAARRVGFPARDGMETVATGRIDFYDAQGSVQLYVDKLEPVGQGALELELQRLMAELRELGYFDPGHKKPLPAVPRRIAVVTSGGAAALQDVIDTANRRWPGCRLVLVDVRVQGKNAAPQIAKALKTLSKHGEKRGIDAVILTRGGGSIEDLWAFNERAVADAVYKCRLPVVAAIGHETDTTIAELVADVRCATPTQAAMTVVPEAAALGEQITQLQRRLSHALRRQIEHARQRTEAAGRHRLLARPELLVESAAQKLERATVRLGPAMTRRIREARRQVNATAKHLDAVGPARVLERGFTYTTDANGNVLRGAEAAREAGLLTTVFADGPVASVVETPGKHAVKKGTVKKRPGRKERKDSGDSPTLFS